MAAQAGQTGRLEQLSRSADLLAEHSGCQSLADWKNEAGQSALGVAAAHGKSEAVERLARYGIASDSARVKQRINAANYYGHTPILSAAYNGQAASVKLLIGLGADVNRGDKDGTPLENAARRTLEILREDNKLRDEAAPDGPECVQFTNMLRDALAQGIHTTGRETFGKAMALMVALQKDKEEDAAAKRGTDLERDGVSETGSVRSSKSGVSKAGSKARSQAGSTARSKTGSRGSRRSTSTVGTKLEDHIGKVEQEDKQRIAFYKRLEPYSETMVALCDEMGIHFTGRSDVGLKAKRLPPPPGVGDSHAI